MAIKLRDIFIGNFPVTQNFGARPEYYKQFGLAAHEGIDWGTPVGTPIISATDGIVVRDIDDPKSGAYGIFVVVWDKVQKCATYYCHLSRNTVAVGDAVVAGQLLGYSGNTGNSSGPHLHFGLVRTDENGVRTDQNNGYKGFVNPLDGRIVTWEIKNPTQPVLIPAMTPAPDDLVTQIKGLKDQVAVYKQQIQDLATKLGTGSDFADIIGGVRKLVELEDELIGKQKEIDTAATTIGQQAEQVKKYAEENTEVKDELHKTRTALNLAQTSLEKADADIAKLKAKRAINDYTTLELTQVVINRLIKRG